MKTSGRDAEIYDYISDCIKRNGYGPSVRDIQSALNIKSTSTVHAALGRLESEGLIHKEQGKSRTLRLDGSTGKGRIKSQTDNSTKTVDLPILGRVAAGLPIFADENIEGYVSFPLSESELKYDKFFALRVQGDSMIDAGILNGDIIIVKKADYAENGTIVVAGVGDEATVKRFYRENGKYRLQPENSEMEPIIVDEAYILGIVTASVRYY